MTRTVTAKRERLAKAAGVLDALSPMRVLARGYAMATRDGEIIKSVRQVEVGDRAKLVLADGEAEINIISITENQ
jgi:exodeoxyribonuclease VII large subunit